MTPSVTVKCVACGHQKDVGIGEVPAGELPMCEKCGSPMAAVKAKA